MTNDIIFYFTAKEANVEHQTDAPIIVVKAWERGFYPIYTKLTPEDLNRGLSTDILEAALIASAFGWHVPAAKLASEYVLEKEKEIAVLHTKES